MYRIYQPEQKSKMNGKERIFATLSHKKKDRYALGYDATSEVTKGLIKYFKIDQRTDLSVSKIGTFRSLLGVVFFLFPIF